MSRIPICHPNPDDDPSSCERELELLELRFCTSDSPASDGVRLHLSSFVMYIPKRKRCSLREKWLKAMYDQFWTKPRSQESLLSLFVSRLNTPFHLNKADDRRNAGAMMYSLTRSMEMPREAPMQRPGMLLLLLPGRKKACVFGTGIDIRDVHPAPKLGDRLSLSRTQASGALAVS